MSIGVAGLLRRGRLGWLGVWTVRLGPCWLAQSIQALRIQAPPDHPKTVHKYHSLAPPNPPHNPGHGPLPTPRIPKSKTLTHPQGGGDRVIVRSAAGEGHFDRLVGALIRRAPSRSLWIVGQREIVR